MALMSPFPDNRGDPAYRLVLAEMADRARAWPGPVVVTAHVDPDGDALGSCLTLARALRALGKRVTVPMRPPSYLAFLAQDGELAGPVEAFAPDTLLFVLDVGELGRMAGAPTEGAAVMFNIDHHGTNTRFGDLAVVEPGKAATAILIKELVDSLGVPWSPTLATGCLAGILTDTGNFRFGNTDRDALTTAGHLIEAGVDYPALTDRLQWRSRGYFALLGRVMSTVAFDFDGAFVYAQLTNEMRSGSGEADDDSDDFVGVIRYAEGTKVAALLKERGEVVKVSVRTRAGASAQRICLALGGGGHVAAAGATVAGSMDEVKARVLEAVGAELGLPDQASLRGAGSGARRS